MILNFPNSPTDGQEYEGYIYNATKGVWDSNSGFNFNITDLSDVDTTGVEDGNALVYDGDNFQWIPGVGGGGGGSSFTISPTPPESPGVGDVWYSSLDGNSYIYYEDEDSSQWVETGNAATGPVGPQGLHGIQGIQGPDGRFFTSDTEPEDPENGDVWFNTSTGVILVYYTDEDSSQWVESGYPVFGPTISLDGLIDTDFSYPNDGDTVVYDSVSEKWINATPVELLNDLSDTTITSPNNGEALVYDTATQSWINSIPAVALDDLTDVDISLVADNNLLRFDSVSGQWLPYAPENDFIRLNSQTISENYTLPAGYNGLSAGPITIADGVTVTIPDGSAWSIV
jgi:hypothetical protein